MTKIFNILFAAPKCFSVSEEHSCNTEMEASALKMMVHVLYQRRRCLKRERCALDCGEDRFLLSQSAIEEWQSDLWAALCSLQSKQALSQFRVVAPFLWCEKLYSRSESTGFAVWTWLGCGAQCCLVQNPSICWDLNETLRSHQTFLKWVSNHSASQWHGDKRRRKQL